MGLGIQSILCFSLAIFAGFFLSPRTAQAQAAPYLDLEFNNLSSFLGSSANQTIYVYFSNPNGVANTALPSTSVFDISYNGATLSPTFASYTSSSNQTVYNALSNAIALNDVTDATFRITKASSVAVYLAFGSQFSSLQTPPGFFSDSVGGNVAFQNFEITRLGGNGDQGNLTNINYFTAPLSITSYAGATQQQSVGFTATTGQIYSALQSLSSNNTVQDGSGNVLRFVGPSTYLPAQPSPYPSFLPYAQAVQASNVTNNISNLNGFLNSNNDNILLTFNLTTGFDSGGNLTLTGSVAVQNTTSSNGTTTFNNTNLTIFTGNETDFNGLVYGQNAGQYPDAVAWDSAWDTLETALVNDYLLTSANFDTFQATVIGEITSAFLMGFLGNTTDVNGTPLNAMPSMDWWQLDPMQAFAAIQPSNPFYNVWANEIYEASGNGAYSIPYSDRLGSGPLVNSVYFNGEYITKWVVGISDPVSVIPEPSTAALAFLGLSALALLRRRKNAASHHTISLK